MKNFFTNPVVHIVAILLITIWASSNNNGWVIGIMMVAIILLPPKYDPAIRFKERNELSRNWAYRVRDCKTKTTTYYSTLDQVFDTVPLSNFLHNNIRLGFSSTDGIRYKIDVRGTNYDNTWDV